MQQVTSRWRTTAAVPLVLWTAQALAAASEVEDTAQPISSLRHLTLSDIDGRQRSIDELSGKRGTLFVFVAIDCPMSNSYLQPLMEIAHDFESRGLHIVLVNPSIHATRDQITRHAHEYGIRLPVLHDPELKLADLLGARITPETFLIDARWVLRYRGRVDDQYVTRLKRRQQRSRNDVRQAIEELLDGKPISVPSTEPLGCPIFRPVAPNPAKGPVTFNRDIMPILQARCQACHRPGQAAPFSLMNYRQAAQWAEDIERETAARRMPPWKPVAGFGEFRDEQRLTDGEVETIAAWVRADLAEGARDDLPSPRQFPTGGWQLGEPDLVLTMEEFEVYATGRDIIRQFVVPTELQDDKWVTAVEFHAGNARVAHHAIFFTDTSGRARQLDAEDPEPGFSRFGFAPTGGIGGWAVGTQPQPLPEGVGMQLAKNADIVVQMHYHPTGKVEKDQSSLGVYFAKSPVKKPLATIPVFGWRFQWPAGEERIKTTGRFRVPVDLHALSVFPHMHMLGREFKMHATLPDGSVVPLIQIDDWDFNWQQSYMYKSAIGLPKGTTIDLESYADNSSKNPVNPNNPPRAINFGEQSTDEMCLGFVGCTVDNDAEYFELLRLRQQRRQVGTLLKPQNN